MEYKIDENLRVILTQDGNDLDIIGPFDTKNSAKYWGDNVCAKYNDNPTYVYPNEEPVVSDSTEL